MCIPEKDDCPINDIIVNFDNEELSKDNKKLNSSEYTLSYINTAIDTAYAMGKTAASVDTTNISVKYNVFL